MSNIFWFINDDSKLTNNISG